MTDCSTPHGQELRSMDVGTLLPQGEAFRMVDTLLHCEGERAVSETIIRSDNPFCGKDGKFMEAGLLENIAQTCALRMGFMCRQDNGTVPKAGVIAAVRRMDLHCHVNVGDTLHTEVVVEAEAFGMSSCHGQVKCNGILACEAELRLML